MCYSNRSIEEWNNIVLDICKVRPLGKHAYNEADREYYVYGNTDIDELERLVKEVC